MGDKSRTSNMHFGMGLYITSSIIKQHGGQLVLSNSKRLAAHRLLSKFHIRNLVSGTAVSLIIFQIFMKSTKLTYSI